MFRTGATALIAAAGLCAAVSSSAEAATLLSVGASSLCGPASCFAGDKKSYTQTFTSGGREGVIDISSLMVAKSIVGSVEHLAVKVTFVLADGTEVTWGKYSLNALGGDVVTLGGQTLAWNTAAGDLTVRLDLILPEKGGAGGGGGGGFGSFRGGGSSSVATAESDAGAGFDVVVGRPLVLPSLTPGLITAVPEPGAWAMMILGFGAAGGMLRRKNGLHHQRYG